MRGIAFAFAVVAAAGWGCGFRAGNGTSDGPPVVDGAPDTPHADGAPDGAPDAHPDARPDAMPDAASDCIAAWGATQPTFGTIHALAQAPNSNQSVNTTAHFERDPFLAPDELTIYFARGDTDGDIYVGVRNTISDPFVVETNALANLSGNGDDSKISFDTSNQTYMATTTGGSPIHAVEATRIALDMFGPTNQTGLSTVNTNTRVFDTMVSPDGLRLYFAAISTSAGGAQQIEVAARQHTTDAWGMPAVVGGINSGDGDADPTVANGDLLMVFSSTRGGNGDSNLFFATRANRDDDFGDPVRLTSLNTNDNDSDPWLSSDGCHLYFSSDRNGTFDIFEVDVMP